MSHFSVMVVAVTPEAALAPFHEFECTGRDDKYVIDVDITTEALEKYNADTTTVMRGPDGVLEERFTADGKWKEKFRREKLLKKKTKRISVLSATIECTTYQRGTKKLKYRPAAEKHLLSLSKTGTALSQ